MISEHYPLSQPYSNLFSNIIRSTDDKFTDFYTTMNNNNPYSFPTQDSSFSSFQANTEYSPKKSQKRKAEDPSKKSQKRKAEDPPAKSPEQDLAPDVKEKLDKIKLLNTLYLEISRNGMKRAARNMGMGSNPETARQSRDLVNHFTNVKTLNSKLNMPNADMKEIYATRIATEGIESYSILEESYNRDNFTKTIKGYYYQSGFDFAQR